MTCHREKLNQVEVMGSERTQLMLFSHASITVVGLTHDFSESWRQVWMVAAPLLANAFERALQRESITFAAWSLLFHAQGWNPGFQRHKGSCRECQAAPRSLTGPAR
jgi:hypothetical protein